MWQKSVLGRRGSERMEMENWGGGMIRMHCIQVRNCQRINERYTKNCFLKDPVPKKSKRPGRTWPTNLWGIFIRKGKRDICFLFQSSFQLFCIIAVKGFTDIVQV